MNAINAVRALVGVPCTTLIPTLDTSAQKHCDYYATNLSAPMQCNSKLSPHMEVAGCPGFTGVDPGLREVAAGYRGNGWSEVMAFYGVPARAVQTWIDSVWHRIPLLSPWYRDMGYGGTTTPAKCDTIDFAPGAMSPSTVTAVYPYNGQTSVPTSFDGRYEGPPPPLPATGSWPSGYPVILYLRGGTVQSHQISVDGTTTPIGHVWIDLTPNNGGDGFILYTDAPLTPNTTYRVQIAAMQRTTPLTFDWKFTTGAM